MSESYTSLRILLIEDNPDDVLLVRSALSALHDDHAGSFELIHVIHVDRLSVALQRLAKGGIDVILMGLSVPDSLGIPVRAILQSEASTVPLIVLAARADDDADAPDAGECLYKDRLDGETLNNALHGAIERQYVKATLERLEQDTRARDTREGASVRM